MHKQLTHLVAHSRLSLYSAFTLCLVGVTFRPRVCSKRPGEPVWVWRLKGSASPPRATSWGRKGAAFSGCCSTRAQVMPSVFREQEESGQVWFGKGRTPPGPRDLADAAGMEGDPSHGDFVHDSGMCSVTQALGTPARTLNAPCCVGAA